MFTYRQRFLSALLLILLVVAPVCAQSNNTQSKSQTTSIAQSKKISTYHPGDIVPAEVVRATGYKQWFTVTTIPDNIFKLMNGKSFAQGCTTPREDLRYIRCLHRDIEGNTIVGEIVVNKKIAQKVADIFMQLYEAHYPIQRMRLIDHWSADDEMSMRDNNTSGFCYRRVAGSSTISLHGKGMAVDINTLYNPYYKVNANGTTVIQPSTAGPYVDRSKSFDYKIEKGDLCYRLFIANGFRWGGDWKRAKDYQHFEYREANTTSQKNKK